MAFKPQEVAELTVNGMIFRDWKSILVHMGMMEPFWYYKFQATEGMPLAKNWALMRIRPGDFCSITMAGEHAMEGMVIQRQVAYTGSAHGIEIIGWTPNGGTTQASAQTKTNEFKNKSFQDIASTLLAPLNIAFKPIGPINNKQFPRVNISPGETIWNTLEPLARSRGIVLGSDDQGNVTGGMPDGQSDDLIEGKNILEGRETLSIKPGPGPDLSVGQEQGGTANQNKWGPKITHVPFGQQANQLMSFFGSKGQYGPRINIMEFPGDAGDAKSRSGFESAQRPNEQANVQITVYGWLKPSGGLWRPGPKVHVNSPMLILDEDLTLMAVTFAQDNRSGTRTTLELVRNVTGQKPDVSPQTGGSQ